MFNINFIIPQTFEDELIERLHNISVSAAQHGFIFKYTTKPYTDSFMMKDCISVDIEANYQLVAVYNRRRHLYSDERGVLIENVPYDIKNANVDRCYLCNSVRDRNLMMIVRMNKERCVAIGKNCFASINYNELIINKYESRFQTTKSFEDDTIRNRNSYYGIECVYNFVKNHPNLEYLGVAKAGQLHTNSTFSQFKEYVLSWGKGIGDPVPENWLDEMKTYADSLPKSDFNDSLGQILNDIKQHNNLIHVSAVSLFLFFMYKQLKDQEYVRFEINDWDKLIVDEEATLVDIKITNMMSSFDGKPIYKFTFRNDDCNYFFWYTTNSLGQIHKKYHLKSKSFTIINIDGHKVCKVKGLRGIR